MSMRKLSVAGALLAACLTSGCEHMSNTAKGGLIGGGLGAGLGAAAGGGKGALVGGLLGTAVGGIVGNDMDQTEKRQQEDRIAVAESRANATTLPPPAPAAALGMSEIIQMSREGMDQDVIINQIRATNSSFILSTEDLRTLQANSVHRNVIVEMQNRRPSTAVRVIREQPRYIYQQPAPVYIYESYPPPRPRPVVGVGFYSR